MLKDFFNLIADNSCYGCGQALGIQERCVCWSCLSQIEETGFHHQPESNEAFFRFAGKLALQGAATLYYFDKGGVLQRVLSHLKYQNAPGLGRFLGQLYGARLAGSLFLEGIEAILPVPLHWRKQAARGYNQSLELARGLGEAVQKPVLHQLLTRARFTETQTRKGKSERWQNVKDAFVVRSTPPPGVLIVDDVLTTGSTLEACARVLLNDAHAPVVIRVAGIAMARSA